MIKQNHSRKLKFWLPLLAVLLVITACAVHPANSLVPSEPIPAASDGPAQTTLQPNEPPEQSTTTLNPLGAYTTKEDVALFIHLYDRLPQNFITKNEARALGWSGGALKDIAPGKCIGGDRFGNYENLLPKKQGRIYTECDIDTLNAPSRGAKRLVFSNDGLVFYTDDHYASFDLLYGEASP